MSAAIDPVCGMKVDPARAAGTVEHAGTKYFFCSKSCVAKFTADPEKYLAGHRETMSAPPPAAYGTIQRSGSARRRRTG